MYLYKLFILTIRWLIISVRKQLARSIHFMNIVHSAVIKMVYTSNTIYDYIPTALTNTYKHTICMLS